jgi:hypothetical protein
MRATSLTRAATRLLLLLVAVTCAGGAAADSDWFDVGGDRGVRVQARERDNVRELRATGIIDQPAEEVFAVLCDVRRTLVLVPHLKKLAVLYEASDTALAYQRLEVPTLAPRDFTIRHRCRTEEAADGGTRRVNEWRTHNEAGPPERAGTIRLEVNEGSWVLEEVDGGRRTRATYRLRIDPGGDVPKFIVNTAMQLQVPQLFSNIAVETDRARRTSRR